MHRGSASRQHSGWKRARVHRPTRRRHAPARGASASRAQHTVQRQQLWAHRLPAPTVPPRFHPRLGATAPPPRTLASARTRDPTCHRRARMNVRAALCAFVRAPLPLRPALASRLAATASAATPVPAPTAPAVAPARVVARDTRISATTPEAPREDELAHAAAAGVLASSVAAAEAPGTDAGRVAGETKTRDEAAQRAAVGLRWRCGAVCIPHPEKADKGGEDAYFVVASALGVFDGVGGWASIGVDPGLYSKQLARLTAAHLRVHAADGVRVALDSAARRSSAIGSSTACVLALRERTLTSLNLGDSGFVVVRDGRLIARTSEQQHYFNCPFQLGTDSMDTVEMGATLNVQLEHGDWLIVATDGLWDNVFDTEVLDIVKEHHTAAVSRERARLNGGSAASKGSDASPESMDIDDSSNSGAEAMQVDRALTSFENADPQALAQRLADLAQKVAADERVTSPFAMNAQQAGHLFLGGKMDDITVVVALVLDPDVDGVQTPDQELSNTSLKTIEGGADAGASAHT